MSTQQNAHRLRLGRYSELAVFTCLPLLPTNDNESFRIGASVDYWSANSGEPK